MENEIIELGDNIAQRTAVGGGVAEGDPAVHAPRRLGLQAAPHALEVEYLLPVLLPLRWVAVHLCLSFVLHKASGFIQQRLLFLR